MCNFHPMESGWHTPSHGAMAPGGRRQRRGLEISQQAGKRVSETMRPVLRGRAGHPMDNGLRSSAVSATAAAWRSRTADGSGIRFIASVSGTNHVLPSMGERVAWSPDGKRLAFISSTPGPEEDANGDPMVITRYSYKPTASEGLTRFDDNRRLHIFVADLSTRQVKQLTSGNYYEHSIQWSPNGQELLFISNHEADPDRVFNYDVFALNLASGAIRQLTKTRNAEYQPVWSPDGRTIAYLGTKRELTSSETTMEDTHVWIMNADGSNRRELGQAIDNRQRAPRWAPDGKSIYTVVQVRGSSHLYRVPIDGSRAGGRDRRRRLRRIVGAHAEWRRDVRLHLANASRRYCASEGRTARHATSSNSTQRSSRSARIAPVEAVNFKAKDGLPVEAYLTMPLNRAQNQKSPDGSPDPRRAARCARPRVQRKSADLRDARIRHADGELPRFDRLRPSVRRRDFRRPKRQGSRGCVVGSRRGDRQATLGSIRRASASRAAATVASSPTGSSRALRASRRRCPRPASRTS